MVYEHKDTIELYRIFFCYINCIPKAYLQEFFWYKGAN